MSQQSFRNIKATKRYLKEKDLLAVPYDKSVDICLMKRVSYEVKLSITIRTSHSNKKKCQAPCLP